MSVDANTVAALAARAAQVELNVYPRFDFVPVRGSGCELFDSAGERWLDMYAGHAVALTGHCHPHVVAAIKEQADQLVFYSNAVHCEQRIAASELLLQHAPHPGSRVFYACSGSEANETAIKIARKHTGRRKVISFERSFHGRTIGTLSASGLEKYRATAGPALVEAHQFVPFGDLAALNQAADDDTAAILCETVQSLGGVHAAEPAFYHLMADIAQRVGAVLIFDEVQSGFGRTGSYFYADRVCVKPDLITMAKGVASGLPVGAVIVAPHLAEQIGPGDQGSTFGGGPIPMAAMRATLEVIERENLVQNAAQRGEQIVSAIRDLPGVKDVRGCGLLLGVEIEGGAKPVQQALRDRQIITGSSSDPNTLRLLPPLVLTAAQADEFTAALTDVMKSGAI